MVDTLGRERRWGSWEPVVLAPVFAFAAWQPVAHLAAGRGEVFGVRGWPMLNVPLTLVVSIVVVTVVAWAFMGSGRPPTWACVGVALSGYALLVAVYLQWVGHYAPVTDRATALEIGWRALVSGQNPYAFETQLGNTIAPMLGGILLAGPVVALFGDLWWYGLIWLAVALTLCWRVAGPRAAAAVAILAALSPQIRLELYSQSDAWINAFLLVLFGSVGVTLAARVADGRRWQALLVACAVLFGLALAYRFILAPVVLPLLAVMWRRHGLRVTALFAGCAGMVSLTLIVVPWLIDPSRYGPGDALHHATSAIPHFSVLLAVATMTVFVVGTFLVRSLADVWATTAAALVVMVALLGWGRGWDEYQTVAYNGIILVFLLAALVLPRDIESRPSAGRAGPTWPSAFGDEHPRTARGPRAHRVRAHAATVRQGAPHRD